MFLDTPYSLDPFQIYSNLGSTLLCTTNDDHLTYGQNLNIQKRLNDYEKKDD